MEQGSIVHFLENKTILITGATGFLAKIFVEKILRIQPNINKLYLLIRAENSEYDVAMGINTMGALHVLNFAKNCAKIRMLVHVSTAYVWGERGGVLPESPFYMCETLNGTSGLDIYKEKKLIEERLHELHSNGATEEAITLALKDLGVQRARLYGWPNTYVFSKAMGEMVLGHLKGNLPLVIVRPTVITSTYKEPFPGWVEGLRTIDSFIVAYGKGKLSFFPSDPTTIIDVIPADMVVNSIIVAIVIQANQPSMVIYQVGSSARNPVRHADLQDYTLHYFTKNPWISKDGKPIKVRKITAVTTMASFHRHMATRRFLLLKGLKLANMAFCQYFQGTYMKLNRQMKFLIRLIELFKPYFFFMGIFDDTNSEKLQMVARETTVDAEAFGFNSRCIDWEDYFMNTHIPGVVKYLFK
ncbi:fatty acyl-CoA reductase 3-like [Malania oleifera]|uniref:fatty acyl-CoA reductase 3-like n=1 Tax=Malania oleifera TaxID=397392 RepID=UPI0025AE3DC1|nr:fatty acyl-CoA reductase 3-like [Malania oleifera]